MNAHFVVEGESDFIFLKDLIKHTFNIEISQKDDATILEGKDKLNVSISDIETSLTNLTQIAFKGKSIVIIFDANGNYANRKAEIEAILAKANPPIPNNIFLFPNNNENGDLETLLLSLTNPEYTDIMACFDSYRDCLMKNARYKDRIPNNKHKVYSYVYTLLDKKEKDSKAGTKRDYLNKDHWNLEDEALNPLKDFLSGYLK